jgi:hypothetical protein
MPYRRIAELGTFAAFFFRRSLSFSLPPHSSPPIHHHPLLQSSCPVLFLLALTCLALIYLKQSGLETRQEFQPAKFKCRRL